MSCASSEGDAQIAHRPSSPPETESLTEDRAEDVLAQVSDFESRFAAFKDIFRKQAILQLEIRRQQAAVAERDSQAVAREQEVSQLRDATQARAAELEARRAELDDRELRLMERGEALEAAQAACRGEREEVAARVSAAEAQLADENERLAALATRLGAEQSAAGERRGDIEMQEADVSRRLSDVEEKRSEAKAAQDGAAKRFAELCLLYTSPSPRD